LLQDIFKSQLDLVVRACVTLCCSVLHRVAVCYIVLQCVTLCCSVLHCVAVCYLVLQCVTLCCSVLHCRRACARRDVLYVLLECAMKFRWLTEDIIISQLDF